MYRLAWHFDFHSHKNIRINHDPDAKGMARTLKQCGVEEIITFAKGHNGFAYYPTTVGTVHPRMVGDPFGEVVQACKAEGVRVLAYVSFGIDGEAGRKHPDWAQVFADGPRIDDDWFIDVCPFTPYPEELMFPMIEEILKNYPVDGFFFDTMGAMGICYCDSCEKQFQAKENRAIPRNPGDPDWGVYGQFRHERAFRMIERIGKFIAERKPDAKVGFNQVGNIRYPEPMPEGIGCLTMDFKTYDPQSLTASMCAAYGSTAKLPADVMATAFNNGWGDWSPRPFTLLEQISATIWAHKCRPYIGSRLHPANRLEPVSIGAMKFMADLQNRIAEEQPAPDSELVPDILVLNGRGANYGEDMSRFAVPRDPYLRQLVGCHHLLLDAGANFSIAAECFLAEHIAGTRLVVLPEMESIEPATEKILRKYVEGGGRILIVGCIPKAGGRLLDWTGLSREEKPWQDHIYVPLWTEQDEKGPVLIRGDFHKLNLSGAESMLPAIRPYDCDHGVRFGWGLAPPSDEPSEFSALTRCPVGKGEVWYMEAPIFSDYKTNGNWTQIEWLRQMLHRVIPQPVGALISASGSVELVVHANESTTWAFLINHGGEQLNGQDQKWARTLPPVPAFPVTLKIREPSGRQPESVTAKGRDLPWKLNGGAVEISMIMDEIWRIVCVDWK